MHLLSLIIYTIDRYIVGIKKNIKNISINNSSFGGNVCSDICPQTFKLFWEGYSFSRA